MNIINIYPTSCTNFNSYEYNFCLPKKVKCNPYNPDGLLTDCGEEYNCNAGCNTTPYYIPAVDIFYIQTRFITSSTPTVSFLDIAGNTIVANAVKNSLIQKGVQTYEIDPSMIPSECFQVKVSYDGGEACSHFFKKPTCEDDYVSFESFYKKRDCIGQIYENTFFSNKVFLKGTLKYYNSIIDDEGTTDIYRFYTSESIAPFMYRYIVNVILSGKKILINDGAYTLIGSNVAPLKSGMFAPIFEFEKRCLNSSKAICDN